MPDKSYLVFGLNGERFACDALAVKESLWLPELTLEEEVPAFIAGAFNLRGKIVHVMDLGLRLGHQLRRYNLSDRVLVLDLEGRLLGIIVNDVIDVVLISTRDIEEAPGHGFIAGEAKVGEEIVMVIDHEAIFESGSREPEPGKLHSESHILNSGYSPEERAVFHERALELMKETAADAERVVPLAVFGMNGEYYGANLEAIREFSDIRSVTPVPCCPPHIIGNMNLRGDILTLVDIKGLLNLPVKSETAGRKAIVVQVNELLAGILVNEVFEVIYLKPSDIRPVPAAVEAGSSEYIKGEVEYGGKMLSLLDLHRILTRDELVVNEGAGKSAVSDQLSATT